MRITRIIAAALSLLGRDEAAAFQTAVTARNTAAGKPVNRDSLRHWDRALG